MRAAAALAVGVCLSALAARADDSAFRVIVNEGNPAQSVERKFLADAFLKKLTRWPGDQVIQPVDMVSASPVRKRFSKEVLERSVAAVKSYWQQLIFSGRSLPAPELESDAAVVSYVATHPGGVGYVSERATLRGVKVIPVR